MINRKSKCEDTKAGDIMHEYPKSQIIKTKSKYNMTEALETLLCRRHHEFRMGCFVAASSFRACSEPTNTIII